MSKEDNSENLTCVNSVCSHAQISGDGSLSFLNNLLISDLTTLSTGKFHYSALCNPKGRIISSVWICINTNNSLELIYPKNMNSLIAYLNMRTFRQKIEIHALTSDVFIKEESNTVIVFPSEKIEIRKTAQLEYFYNFMFNMDLPWIDIKNTEKFIPQHVNLDLHDKVMNFTKGCYPGQEIIARLKYLGKIKKRMKLQHFGNKQEALECAKNNLPVSPIIFNEKLNRYQLQIIIKLLE